jgi:hypothetical protein
MSEASAARQRKSTSNYGANTPVGGLNSLSKTTWWEIKGKVMAAAKEVLLDCLSPKHHDQWEFAAHKCFQMGFKKMSKQRKSEEDSRQDDAKHAEVLRRVARLYITSKQDGVPRDQLLAICSVVNTTVSMDEWNELLKEVHREMVMEKQLEGHSAGLLNTSSSSLAGDDDGSGNMLLPPPPLPDQQQQPLTFPDQQQPLVIVEMSQQQQQQSNSQVIRVSWRAWQLAKEDSVETNASISRKKDRENEKMCKTYESNKAIATVIRLVEEESGNVKEEKPVAQDPMAVVIQNRLGYQSATLFADKLDIMQKIIKAYREAENTEEKDFLLGLVSGSFTREEVNKIIVPPEAQIMLPGRVRNTALISGHKWTSIRKAAGCPNMNPKLDPEKYVEGVKKRKRTMEERRALAGSTYNVSSGTDSVVAHVTHATGV